MDEIIINKSAKEIYAGGAITLNQLNQALSDELDPSFKVMGADLTSYAYAQVGATFMTGGMGPQRRYFSDSVMEISLHNGNGVVAIEGATLDNYAGTYGWTGLVTAVKCRFHQLPSTEVAFAIPVNNTASSLAKLLQHFSTNAYLELRDTTVKTIHGETDLILGLEHVTTSSMQPLFSQSGDNSITKRAKQLVEKCNSSHSDGLIFVNGYSNQPVEEFLLALVDDDSAEVMTIAEVNLEHTEIFNDPEQMRALREAIPFAARTQKTKGKYAHKGHTDANIWINPTSVEATMKALWETNIEYVESITEYFTHTPLVNGEILVYGHLNPSGVDPHNRITFSSDNESTYKQTLEFLRGQKSKFLKQIAELCNQSGSVFIGGEKSAGSEHEMLPLFESLESSPPMLSKKFQRQYQAIQDAPPMYNWRALPPYFPHPLQ
ncbi:MAG: hypothetical protein GKR96_04670 [Gammaproteobacteria bacterium]|nr:hypothetical protein [Gammaproteobacteria bacterium]